MFCFCGVQKLTSRVTYYFETRGKKFMRSTFRRTITSLVLVIAMVVGMTASLGGKAQAASEIKITFNANGGYSTTNGQQKVEKKIKSGSTLTLLTTFARPGFSLSEWQVKGKNTKYGRNQSVKFTSNTELLAVWVPNKITITYDLNGGTWKSGNTSQSYTYGNKYTLTPPTGTKTGYTLKGWNTKKDGSGTLYQSGQTNTMFSVNTTLYAIWSPNSGKITYHENGGQVGAMGSNGMTQPYTVGKSITLSPPNFYRDGCTLLGFSTDPKDSNAPYKVGKSYKFDRDTTLYAIWQGKVSYNFDGKISTQSFISGKSFTLNPPANAKEGLYIAGYSKLPSATRIDYTAGQVVTFSTSITLYPVWKKKNKAIVVFPGILGSNLYSSDGSEIYTDSRIESLFSKIDSGKDFAAAIDLQSICGKTASFSRLKNGGSKGDGICFQGQYIYKPILEKLRKTYSNSEYEIVLYEYDWRMRCSNTAKAFKNDVASKYDSMVLIGHSMGGLVISNYIAMESSKVEKAFFLGTPFLGAPLAAYLLDSGHFTKEFLSPLDDRFSDLSQGDEEILDFACRKAFSAIDSNKDLLPDTNMIKNYSDDYSNPLKQLALDQFYNWDTSAYWYTQNKIRHHITNKVDSYYIVGTNYSTIYGLNKTYTSITLEKRNEGDSIVPVYSASLFGLYPSKTKTLPCSHMDLVTNDTVINYILEKMK